MSNSVDAHGGRIYASVDLSDNSTTVYASPCRLWGVKVIADTSAHTVDIKDGSNTLMTIPASQSSLVTQDFHGVRCETNLVVDPDDSATGTLLVIYEPIQPSY